MLSSGFGNAPVSQYVLFSLVASSILVSVTDVKYIFYVQAVPHIWRYRQLWRILIWQLCYTNSTELLFAGMLLYHMRIIERLWGSRKFMSFCISILPFTTILPPALLALVLRPLTFNRMNYLPAGPTALAFALLAQYHATIPHVYKYRLVTSRSTQGGNTASAQHQAAGLTFTDKSTTYLLAGQLALAQFPGSLLSAVVGWMLGYAWRNELLPGGISRWRIPAWLLREKHQGQVYEGLRRRLEAQGGTESTATGSEGPVPGAGGRATQRRTLGTQILDQFRGAF
ncbi:MAG: hypothetical protein M1817_003094 [Caeruleum heppii]|nr:MAG: hypothetical protein M1817_003094 [Caeruleum heppii]